VKLPTVFANYSVRELILMVDNKKEPTPMELELAHRMQDVLDRAHNKELENDDDDWK
jgi:hypothetical protein